MERYSELDAEVAYLRGLARKLLDEHGSSRAAAQRLGISHVALLNFISGKTARGGDRTREALLREFRLSRARLAELAPGYAKAHPEDLPGGGLEEGQADLGGEFFTVLQAMPGYQAAEAKAIERYPHIPVEVWAAVRESASPAFSASVSAEFLADLAMVYWKHGYSLSA